MIDLFDFLIADEVCDFSSEHDNQTEEFFINSDQENDYLSPFEEE